MSAFNHLPSEQQLLEWSTRTVFAVTLVWLVAAAGALALRRSSAAVRHRVWALTTAATLCLPAILHLFPVIPLGLLYSAAVSGNAAPDGSLTTRQRPTPGQGRPGATDEGPFRSRESLNLNAQDAKGANEVAQASQPSFAGEAAGAEAAGVTRDARGSWLWLACWAIPALISLGGMVRATRLASRLVAQSHVVEDEVTQDLLRRLVAAGPATSIALRESDAIYAPICAGVRRASILLPSGWRSWRPERLEAVLVHEAAHAMRRDVLWQLVARGACAVYWFHPLSWLAASRMRVEREAACDDWALRSGRPSRQYAGILVDVAAELNQTRWAPPQAAVAMASRHPLERRVQAILSANRCRNPITRRAARWLTAMTALAIVAAGVLSPFARSTAEDRTSSAEPQAEGAKQAESKPAHADQAAKTTAAVKTVGTTNVEGRVVDESGQGVAGAQVELFFPPRQRSMTVSRDDGSFALGFVRRRNGGFAICAVASGGSLQGYRQIEGGSEIPAVIELVMRPAREVAATVVDGAGNPVPKASVVGVESQFFSNATTDEAGRATLVVPADARLDSVLAFKPHVGFDYFHYRQPYDLASDPYKLAPENHGPFTFVLNGARSVTVRVLNDRQEPLPRELVWPTRFEKENKGGPVSAGHLEGIHSTTDDQGLVRFDIVPADNISPITFFTLWDGPYFSPERWTVNPGDGPAEITARLVPRVPVTGRVTYADGPSAAGAEVQVYGRGHHIDSFNETVHVRDDGTFELLVNPDEYYMFAARIDNLISDARSIAIRQGHPVSGMELVVRQATRIHGRVTVGDESRPMPGLNVMLTLAPDIEHEDLPPEEQIPEPATGGSLLYPHIARHTKTNDKGEFAFYGRYGRYSLRATGSLSTGAYIEGHSVPFVVTGEDETNVDIHAKIAYVPFSGRVVDQNAPKTVVSNARVVGVPLDNLGNHMKVTADANGEFKTQRTPTRMRLFAQSADKMLAGTVEIEAEVALCEIYIGPATSVTGRLIDKETGKPLDHRQVHFGPLFRDPVSGQERSWALLGDVTTDADGRFKIEGLAPAIEYGLKVWDKEFSQDTFITVSPNVAIVPLGVIKASRLVRSGRKEGSL